MGRKIAQAESRAILGQIVGARIGESRAGRVLYVSAAAATLNFAFPPAQAGRCCVLSSLYVLSPGRRRPREQQQRWMGANFLKREQLPPEVTIEKIQRSFNSTSSKIARSTLPRPALLSSMLTLS